MGVFFQVSVLKGWWETQKEKRFIRDGCPSKEKGGEKDEKGEGRRRRRGGEKVL